jgi:hypothetical protein
MTRFNAPTYDVQRPTGQCAFTGRTLEPGEPYVATLVETEDDQLKRLDVASDVWDEGKRPDHMLAYWKSTVPEPEQKKQRLFVDDAVLMNLLRRLADAERPQRIAFRFVLALILMRKKLLRCDRTERRTVEDPNAEGGTVEQHWWVMTPKEDVSKGPNGRWNESETVEVRDPQLDEEGIRQVTEQLSEILEAEL